MSKNYTDIDPSFVRHTDEINDIMTKVPSGLLRWGMTLFFCVFAMIIGLGFFIHYPEVVKTTMKISNSYKNGAFAGSSVIRQNDIMKLHGGQDIIIKIRDGSDQSVILKGKIRAFSQKGGASHTSTYIVVNTSDQNKVRNLTTGMVADAEIITRDATILERISRNVIKVIDNK